MHTPKVFFNISFTTKNPPKNASAEDKRAHFLERSFYNCTAKYNYITYTSQGKVTEKNKDILSYTSDDKKATGIFGLNGPLKQTDVARIKKQLKDTDSNIWHGFYSFDEDASEKYVSNQEKAAKFLKRNFAAFLKDTHLNADNIEVIASLHENTDNKHIHFFFYEKQPLHRNINGKLQYTNKGAIDKRAIEDNLIRSNLYFDEYKHELYTPRDRAVARIRNLSTPGESKILAELKKLAAKLPKTGRLSYNSNNMKPLRKQIDKLVCFVAASDTVLAKYQAEYDKAVASREAVARQLCIDNRFSYIQGKQFTPLEVRQLLDSGKDEFLKNVDFGQVTVIKKLKDDFAERQGNAIIDLAIKIRNGNPAKKHIERRGVNNKILKIAAAESRRNAKRQFNKFMFALCQNAEDDFKHNHDKLVEAEKQMQFEAQAAHGEVI